MLRDLVREKKEYNQINMQRATIKMFISMFFIHKVRS